MLRAVLSDPCCLVILVAAAGAVAWKAGGWLMRSVAHKNMSPQVTQKRGDRA